jgi:hypothetical protein
MFLSADENRLFCVFEKKVIEIDMNTLITTDVYLTAHDEIIATYDNDSLIIINKHSGELRWCIKTLDTTIIYI